MVSDAIMVESELVDDYGYMTMDQVSNPYLAYRYVQDQIRLLKPLTSDAVHVCERIEQSCMDMLGKVTTRKLEQPAYMRELCGAVLVLTYLRGVYDDFVKDINVLMGQGV